MIEIERKLCALMQFSVHFWLIPRSTDIILHSILKLTSDMLLIIDTNLARKTIRGKNFQLLWAMLTWYPPLPHVLYGKVLVLLWKTPVLSYPYEIHFRALAQHQYTSALQTTKREKASLFHFRMSIFKISILYSLLILLILHFHIFPV